MRHAIGRGRAQVVGGGRRRSAAAWRVVAATTGANAVSAATLAAVLFTAAVLFWPARSLPSVSGPREGWWKVWRHHRPRGEGESPGDDTADVLDHLALALRSGAGVVTCLREVAARSDEPTRSQLNQVAAASEWGLDVGGAWREAGARWEPARRALLLAERSGIPPADLLDTAATDLRREQLSHAELAAARLGVWIVIPLGLTFLPAFVLTTVAPLVMALLREVLSTGW